MIRTIVRDPLFLAVPSENASPEDAPVADDLLHTLLANTDRCVGMAANMIGVRKCVIVFECDGKTMEMFNPRILSGTGEYTAQEGCLSLEGTRTVKRCRVIRVQWQDRQGKMHVRRFEGFTAQIIQHETDHCRGILI